MSSSVFARSSGCVGKRRLNVWLNLTRRSQWIKMNRATNETTSAHSLLGNRQIIYIDIQFRFRTQTNVCFSISINVISTYKIAFGVRWPRRFQQSPFAVRSDTHFSTPPSVNRNDLINWLGFYWRVGEEFWLMPLDARPDVTRNKTKIADTDYEQW